MDSRGEAVRQFRGHLRSYKPQTAPEEVSFEHWAWVARQYFVFGHLVARAQASVDDFERLRRHRVPKNVRVAPGVAAKAPRNAWRRTDRVPTEQPVAQRRETSSRCGAVQRLEACSDGGRVAACSFRSFTVPVRRGTHGSG